MWFHNSYRNSIIELYIIMMNSILKVAQSPWSNLTSYSWSCTRCRWRYFACSRPHSVCCALLRLYGFVIFKQYHGVMIDETWFLYDKPKRDQKTIISNLYDDGYTYFTATTLNQLFSATYDSIREQGAHNRITYLPEWLASCGVWYWLYIIKLLPICCLS